MPYQDRRARCQHRWSVKVGADFDSTSGTICSTSWHVAFGKVAAKENTKCSLMKAGLDFECCMRSGCSVSRPSIWQHWSSTGHSLLCRHSGGGPANPRQHGFLSLTWEFKLRLGLTFGRRVDVWEAGVVGREKRRECAECFPRSSKPDSNFTFLHRPRHQQHYHQ